MILQFFLLFYLSHRHIDANKAKYIETLTEAVAIKSVSAWAHSRPECQRMMDWAEKKMKALGITIEEREKKHKRKKLFIFYSIN